MAKKVEITKCSTCHQSFTDDKYEKHLVDGECPGKQKKKRHPKPKDRITSRKKIKFY